MGLSDKDQELLDKLKLLDFIEEEKSKSSTATPNPSGSSMNYMNPAWEIPPVDIDRSQYTNFSTRPQPRPSSTSNKCNICVHIKNFNKFDFYALSLGNSLASEMADSDEDSVVSYHFHTSFAKIV
jgi:hypothetical protein